MSWVTLAVDDGTAMRAWVAHPAGTAKHPGLIILQEAFGVNAHIRDLAERFAREGYVTIAPELFHRTAPGFDGAYDNFDPIRPLMAAMTVEGQSADLRAAHHWLKADAAVDSSRLGAIGWCMGGRVSFLANTVLPLSAAVTFYGSNITSLTGRASQLHGPHLFCWGGQDTHIPPDQIASVMETLRSAEKAFINVEFSEAGHGFFCDARPAYHAASAADAWALTVAFLGRNLGVV